MDRSTYNQGQNAKYDMGINEDDVAQTVIARGPGAVCYGIGAYNSEGMLSPNPNSGIYEADTARTLNATEVHGICYAEGLDAYNQASTGDKAKPLTNAATDSDHVPCVMYWDGPQTAGTLTKNNAGGQQRMPDKDNFNCVVETFHTTSDEDVCCPLKARDYKDPPVLVSGENETNVRYIVRRLTPMECERLQGFPDHWTDIGDWTDSKGKKHKGDADAPRYQALGNSIALPSWAWVIKRLCGHYERPATMASLFDGIGGFPLIWEQINGRGTCLWASEIEEFPISVTKERIG